MKLIVNGEGTNCPDSVVTVQDLLEHFGLMGKQVVVEVNRNILQGEAHVKTRLAEGDKVEIVRFVGGG